MATKIRLSGVVARLLYGLLFAVVWPAFLVLLSLRVELPLPPVHWPVAGWTIAGGGLAMLAAGVAAIWFRGHGLPMNAFPPERLVTTGIFAWVPHPIYLGFCLMCGGASVALGSASGLWLATPVTALGCLALVLGHERLVLLRRFGELPKPWLGPGRLVMPAVRALRLDRLWGRVLRATGRLANGWSAVRIGPLRIMNHVVFSGLAGGVAAAVVVLVLEGAHVAVVIVLMLSGALGAALIGQVLVGSSNKLSRPFGYFGGLAGIAIAGGVLMAFVPQATTVLAAFALAAPWTQAIGRLRCLMQGCCHGAPSSVNAGIVVTNTHSRVCGMAGLAGRPIYPTQLYSVAGNVVLGPVLLGLWQARVPVSVVVGCYLVGAGVTRFIEEAYRGEPMTPIVRGLHVYQWFAVAMYVGGLLLMLVRTPPAPGFTAAPAIGPAAAVGVLFFCVCGAAMSVDLPESKARFSRLSG